MSIDCEAEYAADVRKLKRLLNRIIERAQAIKLVDETTEYEYGDCDIEGQEPPAGECWKTPTQLAEDILSIAMEAMKI